MNLIMGLLAIILFLFVTAIILKLIYNFQINYGSILRFNLIFHYFLYLNFVIICHLVRGFRLIIRHSYLNLLKMYFAMIFMVF